jgi:hypothetical protein
MLETAETAYDEFHNLYEAAKALVEKDIIAFDDNVFQTSDEDEKKFLTLLTDFFLRKRQRQVIDEGLF